MRTYALVAVILLFCGFAVEAQTFSQTTPYETIVIEHDTLYWDITSPVVNGAWGTVSVTVNYDGDFGSGGEYMTIYGEGGINLGNTDPYFNGSDCQPNSVVLTFPASLISSWGADNVIHFMGITTDAVNVFCSSNEASITVEYSYCAAGGPVAVLNQPSVTSFCTIDSPISLTATPSGGTLSGAGVSGNQFNPSGLSEGQHTLTYTYLNPSGCLTTSDVIVTIGPKPVLTADDYSVYPMQTVHMTGTGNGHLRWFTDAAGTDSIISGNSLTTNVVVTTTYYAATVLEDPYFEIQTLTDHNPVLIEINGEAGDDRGGIAVTTNYVYITGDDYTARYDLDLQNGVSFPRMDALFSDLGTGQLYTLYSSIDGMPDADNMSFIEVTEVRALNPDLSFGSTVIPLSQHIIFGHSYSSHESGVFPGNGFTIIYSSVDSMWYVIDLQDGVVTNLGKMSPPQASAAYAESWAYWGVGEFTSAGYSVLFRADYSYDILRRVLPDEEPTVVASFYDLNDMASFTYAPWNDRWYMHFEGASQFPNSYEEVLMYLDASSSTGSEISAGLLNCPASITITVPSSLPVELVSFTAERKNNAVQCNWVTASERDFDFFTVERSTSGLSFLPLGTVQAAGNSQQTRTYSLTDQNPAQGMNYYRLKMVDIDGTIAYSDIISHKFGSGVSNSIYPNPATESIYVNLENVNTATAGFLVYDAAGRLVLDQKSNGTVLQKLDISPLSNGTYMLHLEGDIETHMLFMVAK